MDACYLLLGRPWQYDRHVMYDGLKNTYSFSKDGSKIVLAPLEPKLLHELRKGMNSLLMCKAENE